MLLNVYLIFSREELIFSESLSFPKFYCLLLYPAFRYNQMNYNHRLLLGTCLHFKQSFSCKNSSIETNVACLEVKLFTRSLLLVSFCSLLVTFCSLLVTFCSLLITSCSLLVTCCSFVARYFLLVFF